MGDMPSIDKKYTAVPVSIEEQNGRTIIKAKVYAVDQSRKDAKVEEFSFKNDNGSFVDIKINDVMIFGTDETKNGDVYKYNHGEGAEFIKIAQTYTQIRSKFWDDYNKNPSINNVKGSEIKPFLTHLAAFLSSYEDDKALTQLLQEYNKLPPSVQQWVQDMIKPYVSPVNLAAGVFDLKDITPLMAGVISDRINVTVDFRNSLKFLKARVLSKVIILREFLIFHLINSGKNRLIQKYLFYKYISTIISTL